MSPERKWTDAERTEAVRVFAEAGGPAAEEATGIPSATIRSWIHRSAVSGEAAVETVADATGVEVISDGPLRPWAERRGPLVHRLGQAAEQAVEATLDAVRVGRGRDARDLAVAAGILIDKAELLSGGATSRQESTSLNVTATRAEIERLRAELDGTAG